MENKDRMTASIYKILFFGNPQALQNLDRYQMQHYGYHIQRVPDSVQPIAVHGEIEPLEEIDIIMRQPPSKSRGDND